jgi:hypothetical protein
MAVAQDIHRELQTQHIAISQGLLLAMTWDIMTDIIMQ